MSALAQADSAENWDEDFELEPATRKVDASDAAKPVYYPLQNAPKSDLQRWGEPGPSTPSKRRVVDAENWDDDFQDRNDSPLRAAALQASPRSRRRRPVAPEHENWDDDFEDSKPTSASRRSAIWDSSSDEEGELGFGEREEDKTVTSRSRRGVFPSILPNDSPPPPVPPIPPSLMDHRLDPAPFPRSPTASVFSVPMSGRDSVAGQSYSSTAHLALRPTRSGSSFGALPPSPPIHHTRERRRLRKKSRPARLEQDIFEMEDRLEVPPRPVTPERSVSPAPAGTLSLNDPPIDSTPSSTGKNSLVSRIGSVGRKWGASRKKRASTGPSEVVLAEQKEPAPHTPSRPLSMALSSSPPVSKGGWFFRHGGGPGAGSGSPPSPAAALPLKHEKSVDRFLSLVGFDPETPSKRKQRIRQGLPSDLTNMASGTSSDGSPKRPTSMQVPSSSASSSRPQGSRHASYGGRRTPSSRGSSVPRSASASVDDVSSRHMKRVTSPADRPDSARTPRKSRSSLDPEPGSRSFMGGMRRMSIRGKHKRSKSNISGPDSEDPVRQSTSTSATAKGPLPLPPPEFANDVTPRPPSRIQPRISVDSSLLPPIELQPPSPPRDPPLSSSFSDPTPFSAGISSMLDAADTFMSSSQSSTIHHDLLPSPKPNVSPPQQSASLGRAAHPPREKEVESSTFPRRNSLGDLKIPARISQAQVGLRRDLGMVRDFAQSVDQLKDLQSSYNDLVLEVQALLIETVPPEEPKPRAVSPTLFGLSRPGSRARSSTNPSAASSSALNQALNHRQLTASYRAIEAKYRISWECAELLIELGGGTPAPTQSASSPLLAGDQPSPAPLESRKSRERSITLAGDEPRPQLPGMTSTTTTTNANAHWRASTGRHDLSQRQLSLLRDMLNNPDTSIMVSDSQLAEDVNRGWRWGDAMSSTITLPSEYSSQHGSSSAVGHTSTAQKRKSNRLGMRGLRDLLKSLKKTYTEGHPPTTQNPPALPMAPSTASLSLGTQSSLNLPKMADTGPPLGTQRRRAKTSVGPEDVAAREHPNSPYGTSSSLQHRASPRRPSLASLFRIGQKSNKSSAKSSPRSGELSTDDVHAGGSSSSCQEEDWDKVESSSDLGSSASPADGPSTVRGKKRHSSPYMHTHDPLPSSSLPRTPRRTPNASQTSIADSSTPLPPPRPPMPELYSRSIKLSDVKELVEKESLADLGTRRSGRRRSLGPGRPSPKRPSSSRGGRKSQMQGQGSLRSPPPSATGHSTSRSPDSRSAALLPDNVVGNVGNGNGGVALAMTPENIRPLLDNAKEVHARCTECIDEMRQLLVTHRVN